MDHDIELAIELLKKHEGYRRYVYKCTSGKLTIGYGLNLEDKGLSKEQSERILHEIVLEYSERLPKVINNFYRISSNRQAVLIDMAYNLGIAGISKFKSMIQAIEKRDFDLAANEMLDSKWAKQVGGRATELSKIMSTNLIGN